MAKAYISDAELSLEEAQNMLDKKYFHRVVRRSQECVELSIKRILRLFGIEYPKTHEVSKALERIKFQVKMPKWLNENMNLLKNASKKLAQQRGPSFYGDERAFIPPEKLYDENDAKISLNMAKNVLKVAKRLLIESKPINN